MLVIGAGPYGLAVASYLASSGIAFRQFGTAMGGWVDHMPQGMHLKSTAVDSSLGTPERGFTIADFCRQSGITPYDDGGGERPIPIEEFIAYGRWFQEQLLPDLEQERVCSVAPSGRDFLATLSTGEQLRTRAVVVSCGTAPFARFPSSLAGAAATSLRRAGTLLHSADCKSFADATGERVAIIGAGQSALECAVLFHESGAEVHLIARADAIAWGPPPRIGRRSTWQRLRSPAAPLGAGWSHLLLTRYAHHYRHLPDRNRLGLLRQILGPAGAWWLRARFNEAIHVHLGREVAAARAHGEGVVLDLRGTRSRSSEESVVVDRVIAATGYQVDVSALDFLDPALRASIATLRGWPRLSSGSESSVPGIFFTGLSSAATFGPMMRFVAGSDFAGRNVLRGVSRRLLVH